MKLNLGRDSEARFGQDFEAKCLPRTCWLTFNFKFSRDANVWLGFYLVLS